MDTLPSFFIVLRYRHKFIATLIASIHLVKIVNHHNPSLENQEAATAHQLVLQVLHGCYRYLFLKSLFEFFLTTIQLPWQNKNDKNVKSVWQRQPASRPLVAIKSHPNYIWREILSAFQYAKNWFRKFRSEVKSKSPIWFGPTGMFGTIYVEAVHINQSDRPNFAVPFLQTSSLAYFP